MRIYGVQLEGFGEPQWGADDSLSGALHLNPIGKIVHPLLVRVHSMLNALHFGGGPDFSGGYLGLSLFFNVHNYVTTH